MNEKKKKLKPLTPDAEMNRRMMMYDAIIEGMPKARLKASYKKGEFGKPGDFDEDYAFVIDLYSCDIENLEKDEKAKLYARYLAAYRMAYRQGSLRDIREILNAMAKLTLQSEQQATVKTNNGDITITFGFSKNEDEE